MSVLFARGSLAFYDVMQMTSGCGHWLPILDTVRCLVVSGSTYQGLASMQAYQYCVDLGLLKLWLFTGATRCR
jgi:hypothetical protein